MAGSLDQSVVIGGAGGIGSAIARGLSEELKHNVIIGDIDEAKGRAVAASIPNCYFFPVDVTKPETLEEMRKYIAREHGNYLTHLVTTAGRSTKEEVELAKNPERHALFGLSDRAIREAIQLNLEGTILTVKYLAELMDNITVVNKSVTVTSSINSSGGYSQLAYSSAKGGIESFVASTAPEFGRKNGIRINAIVPGSTITELTLREGMDPEIVKELTALAIYNEPKHMWQAVKGLVGMEAVTGQKLVVDSGQLLMRPGNRYGSK